MTLSDQVYAQAALLAGNLDAQQQEMLKLLCSGTVNSLAAQLRGGLTPEDCKADFVAAASLYALAALSDLDGESRLEQVRLGDITLQRNGRDAASNCLRSQAALVMCPYVRDSLAFLGV